MSFRYNPIEGTLDLVGAGSGGGPPSSIDDNVFVELRTLTNAEATNRELTLTATPTDATKVILDIVGGTPQVPGDDFQVTGAILSWNGLALETILEENDNIRITYFI